MGESNKCISRIANLSDRGISIPRGTLMAKLEIADEKSLEIRQCKVNTIINSENHLSTNPHIETELVKKLIHYLYKEEQILRKCY